MANFPLAMMLGKLAPVLLALLLALMCGALGHAVLRGTVGAMERDYLIAYPWLSILTGAAISGIAVYGLSLLGELGSSGVRVLVVVHFVIALLNWRFFVYLKNSLRAYFVASFRNSLPSAAISLMAILSFAYFTSAGLSATLVPNLEADTASTYLNAAKLFLQYERLIDVGHFVGNMGKNGFLGLTYAMGLSSANLAHAWVFILTAVGIWLLFLLIDFTAGLTIASLLLVILVSSNFAYDNFIVPAKFDGLSFALVCAILLFLYFWHDGSKRMEFLFLPAFMSGFLAGISYNNIFACALFLAWIFYLAYTSEREKPGIIVALCMLIAAGAAPTYLQNWLLFGNPVYPFAGNFFGSGLGVTIPSDSFAHGYIQDLRQEFSVSSLWAVTGLFLAFFKVGYHSEIQARIDPWLGAVLAVALVAGPFRGLLRTLEYIKGPSEARSFNGIVIAGFLVLCLVWAFNQHILRYLSAAMPLGFVVTSRLLADIGIERPNIGRVFKVLLVATTSVVLLLWTPQVAWRILNHAGVSVWTNDERAGNFVSQFRRTGEWLRGNGDTDEYVSKNFIYGSGFRFGEAIVTFSSLLKPGDKVLSFINGNFYFPREVRVFSGNGSNTLPSPMAMGKPLSRYSSVDEWVADLRDRGFCCVILDPTYLYLSEAEKPIVMSFVAGRKPIASSAGSQFYLLR